MTRSVFLFFYEVQKFSQKDKIGLAVEVCAAAFLPRVFLFSVSPALKELNINGILRGAM
jgi:hypothetical protein